MALTSDQSEILQTLADMIGRTGGGGSVFGSSMGGGRQQKQKTDGSRAGGQELIDQSRVNDKSIQNLNKTLKQIMREGINSSELEKLPEEMRKGIAAANSKAAKNMASSINNLGDVMRTKEQISARKELIATLKTFEKDKEVSLEKFKKLDEIAKRAGVSVGRLINPVDKTVLSLDELERETDELAVAFNQAVNNTTKNSRAVEKSSIIFAKHGAKMKEAFNLYVEELRIARERGVYDAKYLDAVKGLGISMKDYSVILADNRDTQQAMAAGGRDFTAELIEGKSVMMKFSKDNVQAAQTTASLMRGISGFGVSQKNLSGALKEQTQMYEDNYRVFGVTAEAFAKSTEALVIDTDIRSNLSMMAENERKQYILGIQAQESQRIAMGYTTDQARELSKMFASMGSESPKERMKKAAKQRAMMGALGMGAEGAELQKLMVGINQLQGTERAAAEARMAEITSQMSNALQGKYSQGLGTEMFFRSMADKAGVTDTAKKMETLTLSGKEKDKVAETKKQKDREVPEILNQGLNAMDTFNAFQSTSVGLLASILASIIGGALFKKFGGSITKMFSGGLGKLSGGISKMGGTITKTFSGGLGKLSGGISKMGGTIAKSLGAAASVAGGAATAVGSMATKGASAAAGAVKGGGKAVGKASGGIVSKGLLKSGIKKIPIIGALAGIGFGISRAMDGDIAGAGLEVASGVASILPGWGTAASVAIDAGLAARDLTGESGRSEAAGGEGISPEEDAATVYNAPTTKKQDTATSLTDIQKYLVSMSQMNVDLIESTQRLNETGQEVLRSGGFKANRPG